MTAYNTRRKKGFRWLFALVTVTTLAVPYVALGAGPAIRHLHRFGGFGGDVLEEVTISIPQVQPAPSTEPKLAENRIYVPPQWVDGGYGVQVLQPSYWTVPKQAAGH